MVKVEKMSFGFSDKDLYKKVTFSLDNGLHHAFIGTNGTGKSTLIDMIINTENYLYDGKITKIDNFTVGYVSQFLELDNDIENSEDSKMTVFQYISRDFVKMQARIDELCDELATTEDLDKSLEKYQEALDAFQAVDGDNYESNIKKQLKLAGLTKLENIPVTRISGGEFKLIQVIKEMLASPKLLIMDEPDVFLDFMHLNALKELINNHKGTILVVTHNRYLLNHCFNKIIHLEDMQIREFNGSYIEYNYSLLCEKVELQEKSVAEQEEIDRNQKIVDKLREEATYIDSATRGKTLHARVTHLERLQARKTKDPFVDGKQPEIYLHADKEVSPEEVVLRVENYSVGFDEELLDSVSFEIGATDKVAMVGPNGTGKTTILREIFKGENQAFSYASDIEKAYLSQIQGEVLNEEDTMLSVFNDCGFEDEFEIREYLKSYEFDEDGFKRKVSELSGGERNLLQLAKIALTDSNLLLLDEPTSHLDTYSQEALEKAIRNYNGAILMVSHDFYTIANCMDYVLWVENNTVRKVSIRKFRKMIYENHFGKDYIEIEQKKKDLEQIIINCLREKDFKKAKKQTEKLELVVKELNKIS